MAIVQDFFLIKPKIVVIQENYFDIQTYILENFGFSPLVRKKNFPNSHELL